MHTTTGELVARYESMTASLSPAIGGSERERPETGGALSKGRCRYYCGPICACTLEIGPTANDSRTRAEPRQTYDHPFADYARQQWMPITFSEPTGCANESLLFTYRFFRSFFLGTRYMPALRCFTSGNRAMLTLVIDDGESFFRSPLPRESRCGN